MDVNFPKLLNQRMDSPQKTTLQKRVRERMDALGLNALETAKRSKLNDSFVRDILRGKSRSPSAENLGKLAEALETSPDWLMGRQEGETGLRKVSAPVDGVPVVGKVAANTWYTVDEYVHDDPDFEPERIPSVSGFPVEWQFGMIVEGNCLNRIASDGDRLVCLDLIKSQIDIQEDDLVIVERRRFEGMMRQRTAKRVKKTSLGFELWPESDDPAHQEPIRLNDVPEGEEIGVVARVLWILRKP